MTAADVVLAVAVSFAGVVDVLEQVWNASLGEFVTQALLAKFLVGGGGAVTIFMIGWYLRKSKALMSVISTVSVFLMGLGVLAALGVVDINLARIAAAARGVFGA